ncbi:MAG: VOC family protein [Acidothermaceae bacterium]
MPRSLREFGHLARPSGIPLRLLLQRLDDGKPLQQMGAHLDLASDDVDAEVQRHLELGAGYAHEDKGWVTLRDPSGREYCVAARNALTGA